MKKVALLPMLFVLSISTPILAKDFCNISNLGSDKKEIKVIRTHTVLNKAQNIDKFTKAIDRLIITPLDEEATMTALTLLNTDKDGLHSSAQVKLINPLNENEDILDYIIDALVWVTDPKVKEQGKIFFNSAAYASSKVRSHFFAANYKELLIRDNLGMFEYQEDRDAFLNRVTSKKPSVEDVPYYFLYALTQNTLYQPKTLLNSNLPTFHFNSICQNEERVEDYRKRYSYQGAMLWFFANKLDVGNSTARAANLYYTVGNKDGVWEYMEFLNALLTKDFTKAANAITSVRNIIGDNEYLKRLAYPTYYSAAFMASNNNDIFNAWHYGVKALDTLSGIKNLTSQDVEISSNAKSLLQKTSTQLVDILMSKNEFLSVDYIIAQRNKYIDTMFISKE